MGVFTNLAYIKHMTHLSRIIPISQTFTQTEHSEILKLSRASKPS